VKWSECGKEVTLNVKLEARLPLEMTSPAVMLLEWSNLHIRWQKCPEKADEKPDEDDGELVMIEAP